MRMYLMTRVLRTMSLHLFLALVTSKFNYISCTLLSVLCSNFGVCLQDALSGTQNPPESFFNKALSFRAST